MALQGYHDFRLVFLSILIAVFSSYTALYVSSRLSIHNKLSNRYWLISGAIVLGFGVWAMHFIGMLAYKVPTTINYDPFFTSTSILPIVIVSYFVLQTPVKEKLTFTFYLSRSALMGGGIGLMHYLGMHAMLMNGIMVYDAKLFALSIILALGLSAFAIRLKVWAEAHIVETSIYSPRVLLSAIAMGCAISGMHYTSMAALYIFPDDSPGIIGMALAPDFLAKIITGLITVFGVFLMITLEINQRLVLFQKVKRSEETQKIILDTIADAVISTDNGGAVLSINPAGQRLFGVKAESILSKNLNQLLNIEDTKKFLSTHSGNVQEVIGIHNNGSQLTLGGNFTLIASDRSKGYVVSLQDISKRKQDEQKVLHQAHFDSLTNLPNRFLSLDRMSKLRERAMARDSMLAILFLDLDGFKRINDTMGHDAGDDILVRVAERLSDLDSRMHTVGRLGGDEFIILIENFLQKEDLIPILERIRQSFQDEFLVSGRKLSITTSIGVAIYPQDGDSTSTLLRQADLAMYHSKEQGKNNYTFCSAEMNEAVIQKIRIEEELSDALKQEELFVLYQPKIDLRSGKISGAEALIRWDSKNLGNVLPSEFIPVAEASNAILGIGDFVLEESMKFITEYSLLFGTDFQIAVNISPCQFNEPGMVDGLKELLKNYNVSPKSLEFEITEGVLLSSSNLVQDTLESIHQLGIQIAMDDFGTGYSSLSYLRNYPFDVLKIDRSFINKLEDSDADKELVIATIAMAHGLKLKVVAEGIETKEQRDILKTMDCDIVQGYFYGKPMSKSALIDMIHSQNSLQIASA